MAVAGLATSKKVLLLLSLMEIRLAHWWNDWIESLGLVCILVAIGSDTIKKYRID